MPHRIFIGSSVEALPIADALVSLLDHEFHPTLWTANVFQPGSYTLEALLKQVEINSFALFVFAADDILRMRSKRWFAVRDNVVFELGLFLSKLGRDRCFFLLPRDLKDFRLPTDLQGITPLTYDSGRAEAEPKPAVSAAVGDLKARVRELVDGDGTTVSLSGKWIQNWKVKSDRYPPENPAQAEIIQIGSELNAVSSIQGRPFVIRGQIQRGNVVTGTWHDREGGATYFGAFQLIIDPIPKRMVGKWIGFSDNNHIKEGEWIWERISEK
jgi:hypothetical protein